MAVSAARTLLLADYLPTNLRGVTISAPAMWWPPKQSGDELDFSLDTTGAIDPADTITLASARASPSAGSADLRVTDLSVSGTVLTTWLDHGAAGLSYSIAILAKTALGRVLTWQIFLQVMSEAFEAGTPVTLSLPSQTAYNQVADTAGGVITDTSGAPLLTTPRLWTNRFVSDTQGRTVLTTRGLPLLSTVPV